MKTGAPWKGLLLLAGGLVVGLSLGALVFFNRGSGSTPLRPLTVGSEAPDFTLENINGELLSLRDARGKPVVVNFWATWCGPCKEEMPLLEETALRYPDSLLVWGVNSGETVEKVTPFLQGLGITFPVLLDSDQAVSTLYFVRSMPVTYFIDAQGVLRGQHIGLLQPEQLERYLQTIGLPVPAGE